MYKVLLQKPLVNNLHRKNKLLIVIDPTEQDLCRQCQYCVTGYNSKIN